MHRARGQSLFNTCDCIPHPQPGLPLFPESVAGLTCFKEFLYFGVRLATMWVGPKQASHRRLLVIALAVFVFVLALRAKLSLYEPSHPGSVNPASASKLWVNGEKLKSAILAFLPVLWLTALLLFPRPLPHIVRSEHTRTAAPRHFGLRELYRFLRPPPAF